jgi:hypothetical protein
MFCAIDMVAVPITIGCILLGMVLIGGIALYDQRRKRLRGSLPHGAEAALWSVIEVLPDPRNHLAIKDPTSELRLTADERRQAAESAVQARLRAEASEDRPATRAAAERSAVAHKAALAQREAVEQGRKRAKELERELQLDAERRQELELEREREKFHRVVDETLPTTFESPVLFDGLKAVAKTPAANFSIADFAPADLAAVVDEVQPPPAPAAIDLREDTGELHHVHHRAS